MDNIFKETEEIKQRYERRKNINFKDGINPFYFKHYLLFERELLYSKVLFNLFGNDLTKIKILEIGAGDGSNLLFFHSKGVLWENIFANELLPDRHINLQNNLPKSNIDIGNALDLNYKSDFDVVFQSTVFTSILDDDFKKKLANKIFEMAKPAGIILWYDFKYNNPKNPDVKGIKKLEIKRLFPLAKKIKFYNVTVAPPIGRKIGKLYPIINFFFPFLRTHLIAIIYK